MEDPVEYRLQWLNQVQVQPQIGLTFAKVLRSFLRQDPDVIMIGEMRDGETAEIAVQAALTGHMVLSTLHTNSALGAIVRLINMGRSVPHHGFRDRGAGAAPRAQVATIARPCCRTAQRAAAPPGASVGEGQLHARGLPQLPRNGLPGRLAIHELLLLTDDMKRKVLEQGSSIHGSEAMSAEPAAGRRHQGVGLGLTTAEEVLRAASK
ncbi:MAG: ATPase, T2SS/T4P/T4SS family [Burkholderiaceae bacterium]